MNLGKYNKFVVAAAAAVSTAIAFLADGEISQNDVLGIVASFVGALGVYAAPNTVKKGSSWNLADDPNGKD
jgi:hypothetical protein